jgi:hypothetical protein
MLGFLLMSPSKFMAEREGFEPPIPVKVCLISSQVHSTGLCHLSVYSVTESIRRKQFPDAEIIYSDPYEFTGKRVLVAMRMRSIPVCNRLLHEIRAKDYPSR